jgi:hypothetical protein
MAAIRTRPGEAHELQYLGLNIATLPKAIVAKRAYCEMSSCQIDAECHIDNVALLRIAHCIDKSDNDKSDQGQSKRATTI